MKRERKKGKGTKDDVARSTEQGQKEVMNGN